MVDGPGREQLEALLALQYAETTIRRLGRRLDELPEQAALSAARARGMAVNAERDAVRVEMEDIELTSASSKASSPCCKQRRDTEQARLYSGAVANPRELQALRADVDHVARRIATLEDELLQLMERREQLAETLATLERRGQELASEQERLAVARDEAASEVLAELAETKGLRETQRERLSEQLLVRYETSKQRHGGVGVGALEHGICTGCRMELTPLEVSELREGRWESARVPTPAGGGGVDG
ncbi:MAG: hypothetical protein M3O70_27565, partial [Actinomycetota bacterium]|nr:hypothetical protein [Actinomycetota bacterium]